MFSLHSFFLLCRSEEGETKRKREKDIRRDERRDGKRDGDYNDEKKKAGKNDVTGREEEEEKECLSAMKYTPSSIFPLEESQKLYFSRTSHH